jgi:DNA helicase-2/ATP-dependent DNA helicase PcrA
MDFSSRYQKLNTAQKQAVDHIEGPVLVVAGPGTGKTELLSMRAANILRQTDTLPENILCLTFTESGAAAMRERLSQIIGKDAFRVAIHTFHSFGTEIINQNADYFYHGAHFRAADELSSYELLRGIFDELPYDNPLSGKMNGEYTHLGDTLTVIGELKKSGLVGEELLIVLDANEHVMDTIEPALSELFAGRISKATAEQLAPIAHTIATVDQPVLPIGIVPFADALSLDIAHAVDAALETNSTKPITAWRNKWLEKNAAGKFVFKDRKRQAKLRAASSIYNQYLSRMQEAELYDFDDMILRVVHAMEVFPELRYNLQEKHQYIMVDEFQDTNLAQMRILYNLTNNEASEGRPNVMAVGDDDQAIYSFQGADISNILGFENAYRDVEVITLTDNYRSSEPILTAARSVIIQGGGRLETTLDTVNKQLTAHRSSNGSAVTLLEYSAISDERRALVESIKSRIDAGQAADTIAVLARRHHELEKLLPYFSDAGIAVNYERQDNVLDIAPVVALEAVARLVVALYEKRLDEAEALLPEIMTHPAWGFSAENIWQLSLSAHSSHKTWLETMATKPEFVPFYKWIVEAASRVSHVPLEQLIDYLLGGRRVLPAEQTADEAETEQVDAADQEFVSPLFQYFFPDEALTSRPDEYLVYLEALRTLRGKLRDYQPEATPTLQTFIAFIDLHRELCSLIASVRPRSDTGKTAVHIMTDIKSNCLEFDTVHVIGAIDSAWGERVRSRSRLIGYPENLPLAPSGDTLDERLRLFFVAMTRARKELIISYSLHDDSDKPTLGASFLLASTLEPTAQLIEHSAADLVRDAERRWYEPLVHLSQETMLNLLQPTLQNYKLSVTHLNNFLDVTQGGPQSFLIGNLLRFPQAMGPNAAYGSAIHATLQRAHAHLAATKQQRPVEDILRDFDTNLQAQHLTKEDYDYFQQRGSDVLTAFLHQKYDSFTPSQKVELNFAGQQALIGDARLTGALDLVDIDAANKTMVVTDYKTGKPSLSWQGKTDFEKIKLHKYRQQLMFYKLMVERSRDYHDYTVTAGILQFVEPTPAGDITALDLSFSNDELAEFSQLIEVVWRHIMALDLPITDDYEQSYKGVLAFEQSLLAEY